MRGAPYKHKVGSTLRMLGQVRLRGVAQGMAGPQGATGPAGPQGAPGDDAPRHAPAQPAGIENRVFIPFAFIARLERTQHCDA